MKKILILITLTLFAFANDTQIDLLTGDTKLSCEAILCLSSSTRPSECNPSLDRYFSINAKKWKDTVKKRKNFLKLCPVGGADIDDLVFSDLRDNLLPNSDPRQCTAEYLNKQIETNGDEEYYNSSIEYRINPNIPQQCYVLFSHSYTALEKPDYVCSGEFYSKLEWKLSAKLKNISYQEWQNLIPQNRHKIDYSDGDGGRYSYYYEKIPFSKTCWIDKE